MIFCSILALISNKANAYSTPYFKIYGTINNQNLDNLFNPSSGLQINLDSPISFNITFEVNPEHSITFETITIIFKIFGFDILPFNLPIGQSVPNGTILNFAETLDLSQFLQFNGFSIISGKYEIGLAITYTVADTGETYTDEKQLNIIIGDGFSIFTSITGLITVAIASSTALSSVLKPPKSVGSMVTFGTKNSTSGYLIGQQMGYLTLNLPMLVVVIISISVLCGIIGYLIFSRRKKSTARLEKECIEINGKKYCKADKNKQ